MIKNIFSFFLLTLIISHSSVIYSQEINSLNYPGNLIFDGENLILKGQQGNAERYLLEYINPDRNWDTWSNLIAFRNYNGYKPKFVLDYHVANIQKSNPDVQFDILEYPEKENIYILDFLTGTYEGENPSYEFNLWFIFPVSETETVSIQYALRSYENPDLDKHEFNSALEFGEYWTENRANLIEELETLSNKVKTFISK